MFDKTMKKIVNNDIEKGEHINNNNIIQSKENLVSKQSKLRYVLQNITVEPMLGFYIVSSVLTNLATQNLYLDKACRVNLNYTTEVCDALAQRKTDNYKYEEVMVQELVAGMSIWKTFLQSIIPAVLIIFLGSWSDRNCRRKPIMLMPICGEMTMCIGQILSTYYKEWPMEVSGLIEAIIPACTGGWITMFMAVFSYIGNVATLETRTLRIGVVNIFCSVGIPIGTALSGIIVKETGFYGVYSISLIMYSISFFYGLFRIYELPASYIEAVSSNTKLMSDNCNSEIDIIKKYIREEKKLKEIKMKSGQIDGQPRVSFLKDFFDVKYIEETFRIVFKNGEHNRKKRVILIMVVMIVVFGPMQGEMNVLYLFTRYKFNWGEVEFSIFSTYNCITNLFGTMFSVLVFSHLLQIDDALIGVISCVSKISAGFVYAFAATPFVFYLGALVDIVNGTSFIAMRSIISKMVPPNELGKVNSLFGVCEALDPLIYGPMYSAVYRATINTLPGTFYLIGGALTAPAAFIFLWMYKEHKKEAKSKQLAEELENRRKNQIDSNGNAFIESNNVYSSHNKSKDNLFSETKFTNNGDVNQSVIGVDNAAYET